MELEWIDCQSLLPHNNEEVEVIAFVYDPSTEWDAKNSYQRIISTGKFDAYRGWWVRNGFVVNRLPHHDSDRYYTWDGVLFWKPFSEETKIFLAERTSP